MRNIAGSKRVTLFIATAFLLFFNGLLLSGCTLLGMGIGTIIDARPAVIKPWQVDTVSPGAKMIITLAGQERIEGWFARTDFNLPAGYADAYDSIRGVMGKVWLPAIGDSVKARDGWGEEHLGKFIGFGRSRYSITGVESNESLPFTFIKQIGPDGSEFQTAVPVTRVHDLGGESIDHQLILSVINDHRLPTPSKWITLTNHRTTTHVSFQDVVFFRIDEPYVKSHSAWWIGGSIGALFDIFWITFYTLYTSGYGT